MPSILPICAVIPTRNRPRILRRTLESLAAQCHQPMTIIIVDASEDNATKDQIALELNGLKSRLLYQFSQTPGAAAQRNQAEPFLDQPFVLFMDDDILLEDQCIARLWSAISPRDMGGVSAMITNQHYTPPSKLTERCYQLLHGTALSSYAGRCLGPAVNLLPDDNTHLPEVVPVEWLNSTCTLYRREALPSPLFPRHFHGYSMFEDVTLSLMVGKSHRLSNARTSRIFHDSQPGDHKASLLSLTRMEVANRHYVTTSILNRKQLRHLCGHLLWQAYKLIAMIKHPLQWARIPPTVAGTIMGFSDILLRRLPS